MLFAIVRGRNANVLNREQSTRQVEVLNQVNEGDLFITNKSKRHLIYLNSLLMLGENEEHRMAQANT